MEERPENFILDKIERKGRLLLLTFSDGFEVKATPGLVKRLELAERQEFQPADFEKLRSLLRERYGLYCAESLLARRNFSVGEFKERLRQKEIDTKLIQDLAGHFREQGLLDDYKYGQMRIRSVLNRKPAGRRFLIADLQKRLVPREIAEKVVDRALTDIDEVEMAKQLLEKRRASFDKFDIETGRRKAYTYLSRRAISYGAAKAAFNEIFGKSAE